MQRIFLLAKPISVLCSSLFYNALLCVHSSFANILKRKIKLVALLLLSYRCIVTINVLWFFITVMLAGMQCVIRFCLIIRTYCLCGGMLSYTRLEKTRLLGVPQVPIYIISLFSKEIYIYNKL